MSFAVLAVEGLVLVTAHRLGRLRYFQQFFVVFEIIPGFLISTVITPLESSSFIINIL